MAADTTILSHVNAEMMYSIYLLESLGLDTIRGPSRALSSGSVSATCTSRVSPTRCGWNTLDIELQSRFKPRIASTIIERTAMDAWYMQIDDQV